MNGKMRPAPSVDAAADLHAFAHDMRSSLTVVRGFALTLLHSFDRLSPAEMHDSLSAIVRRAEEATSLVDDLTEAALIWAREPIDRQARTDVAALLPMVVAAAQERGLQQAFLVEVEPRLSAAVEARSISHALSALIAHASREVAAGAAIRIQAHVRGEWVEIEVSHPMPGNASLAPPSGPDLRFCRMLVRAEGGRFAVNADRFERVYSACFPMALDAAAPGDQEPNS